MNVLLHRRHLGGDLSWQVAEHDEDGALEQGGAQHRVGMSGNGDVKMYGAELKTLGWSIFMVGILRHITMTFTSSFFMMTAQDYHDKIMILMTMNLVQMMIAVIRCCS